MQGDMKMVVLSFIPPLIISGVEAYFYRALGELFLDFFMADFFKYLVTHIRRLTYLRVANVLI